MNTTNIQTEVKRIEDLTVRELDMIYSLSKTGWSSPEIGRRYRITEADVTIAIDNYVYLRELCKAKPPTGVEHTNPEPDLTGKKPRKRRSDSIYATAKARQAAYRNRLREKRSASIEHPSPAKYTDTQDPASDELSVTACDASVTNIRPDNAETQNSDGNSPLDEY